MIPVAALVPFVVKHWRSSLVIVVLGGAVLYGAALKIRVSVAESKIERLERQLTEKNQNILSLESQIEYQNRKVDEWKLKSRESQQQYEAEIKKYQLQNKEYSARLSRLQSANAESCDEGVALIDEVMGLQ